MRLILAGLFALGTCSLPMLVGCERTIAESETVKTHRDGTVTRDSKSVKEKADGTIVVEEEKNVNR